jgi:DNA-binding MarR family transcriptional regulator
MPLDSAPGRQSLFALHELIGATRSLAEVLKAAARHLHEESGLSVPERALLLELRKSGPLTVPDLARRRAVSRQYVQNTINVLLTREMVAAEPNPAHRRSRLMTLTPAGVALIRQVMRREGALMQVLAVEVEAGPLRQAADTLEQVERLLSGHIPQNEQKIS